MKPDAHDVQTRKRNLRRKLRSRLAAIPEARRVAASGRACALLEAQKIWETAVRVLFYAPMPRELDVWPLISEAIAGGKQAYLPRFVGDLGAYEACLVKNVEVDVVAGAFGIREGAGHCPGVALNRLDLVLVPGLAFDAHGRRLGRGKGFYDRLLSAVRGVKCGIAFDEQLLAEVPTEPHDILLNCILTPTRWIEL